MTTTADNILRRNPDARIYTDAQNRQWITFKAYNGFERKQWWARPINAVIDSTFKAAGSNIADRDRVLDDCPNDFIEKTWTLED